MNNNSSLPKEIDAVLDGQAPPPIEGIVLGGLEGVKRRLQSTVVEGRVAAVYEALNYEEAGLDLVIQSLKNESRQVQHKAFLLLQERTDSLKVMQALRNYDPWQSFSTLQKWRFESFNPQVGIVDPLNTAYTVNLEYLKLLLQDPKVTEVEALICQISNLYYSYSSGENKTFYQFVDTIIDADKKLTNLKALLIGDGEEDIYCRSHVPLGDISLILDTYPNLEVLTLRGDCQDLECASLSHTHLKTLVIETAGISNRAIDQICAIHLPALKYFEFWLGEKYSQDWISIDKLLPVLHSNSLPNLSYLGLRGSHNSNEIAFAVVQSPIIERIAVLDLSIGTLTDEGAQALFDCPAVNWLHTLDISRNNLSSNMIQQLSQLNCRVIAEPQDSDRYSNLIE